MAPLLLLPVGAQTYQLVIGNAWLANPPLQKGSRRTTCQDSDEREGRCYGKVTGDISLSLSSGLGLRPLEVTEGLNGSCLWVYVAIAQVTAPP